MAVAHIGIFWQHAALAGISGVFGAGAALGAALLNRRMTRIEVRLNGRLEQILGPIEDVPEAPKRRRHP